MATGFRHDARWGETRLSSEPKSSTSTRRHSGMACVTRSPILIRPLEGRVWTAMKRQEGRI